MALSRSIFNLKFLKPYYHNPIPLQSQRFLSFASTEEAAAERRRRKRRLRLDPPITQNRPKPPPSKVSNPNTPKLPDSVSVLQGNRLNLHNRILTLIRENDLTEASLLTRHSIYSNCRPTVFTCNAVLAALLRQSRYADFAALHRFIIQAGVVPNIVTYNLLINAYLDCRKYDTALDHYKILINDASFSPSAATYRILVRGLASTGDREKIERAISLKNDMLSKGLAPDPVVYDYLISALVEIDDVERALEMFSEVKEKLDSISGPIFIPEDIVRVYGSVMKAYFKKGMEKEAMDFLEELLARENRENTRYRTDAIAYNSVLQALVKNDKLEQAMQLFDRMMDIHSPPRRLTVNLGSFNVMVDMFCSNGRFQEAIAVFRKMDEKKCLPDTLSYNNLIEQLLGAGKIGEAEEIYGEMEGERKVKQDEFTFGLLIDACLGQNRIDDAYNYFMKMVESGLRPSVGVFNKVISQLLKAVQIDRAKELFNQMLEKEVKPDATSYDLIFKGLCDNGKLDDVLEIIRRMLKEDESTFSEELREVVTEALKKEGREEDLARLFDEREKEKEKEKEEALAKESRTSRISIPSIEALTSKFNTKESEVAPGEASSTSETAPAVERTGSVETPGNGVSSAEEIDVESASDAGSGVEGQRVETSS
ncbi:pentatricopeptide repeat-containing protein At3g49240, mitochondrial [Aristolochia californica]|uniref:pentatricopeptide repeat-containing protein At3g49240, mitochondrial n=1 Tax=Aristolochia californica TaxID=171875 RepID=UPI0035DA6D60